MASIINISQGFATDHGTRSVNKIWKVVNTTLEDETLLMTQAFLPLVEYEEDIPTEYTSIVDSAWGRFFNKGMFLLLEHFEGLNDALESINFKRVVLSTDNNYFQPTLPGKYRPCPKAWKNNGKARFKEMERIVASYKEGNIDLELYRVPTSILVEMLNEQVPEVKAMLKRVERRCDKIA